MLNYWKYVNIYAKVLKCCNERKMVKYFQQSWKCLSFSFETKNDYVFLEGKNLSMFLKSFSSENGYVF